MQKNNFFKIIVGIFFTIAAIWLVWRGWHIFVDNTGRGWRPGSITLWGAAFLAWGWLLLFTIRHYRYF